MTFPIIDFPLSIAHSDGSLLKTDKSKLLGRLETLQNGFEETPLPQVDVTLIDGGLVIHSLLSAIGPVSSYGKLATAVLSHVCHYHGKEIHILFDKYEVTSLKVSEINNQGADDHPFVRTGPDQSPKQNCANLLSNGIFKDQLAQFLLREWQEDHYGEILDKKVLVASYGGRCVRLSYNRDIKKMIVEHPAAFQGKHEEADTLLDFHTSKLKGNVVVRASDTDVMVILIGMLGRQLSNPEKTLDTKIIMDCGSGNSRRYIDINAIATAIESKQRGLASALPGLHAFTGCDFTASFYRKGKIKPYEILEKDSSGEFVNLFRSLALRGVPDQAVAEAFLCSLYGMKGHTSINTARHEKLCQMTGKMDEKHPLKNLKKVDCALLPPCSKTVQNKLLRAQYVSIIWGCADTANPADELDPCQYGWSFVNGVSQPVWFLGSAEPNDLFDDINSEENDVEKNDDSSSENELEWSDDSSNEDDL